MKATASVKNNKAELRELDDQIADAPDGNIGNSLLRKIKNYIKAHPSEKNISYLIDSLAHDGGYYDEIRDYHGGEYAPQELVEDQLWDNAYDDDDKKLAKSVEQYSVDDWLDFDTAEPMTASDAIDIINDLMW